MDHMLVRTPIVGIQIVNVLLYFSEYFGAIEADKREEVLCQLNKEIERLIKVSWHLLATVQVQC